MLTEEVQSPESGFLHDRSIYSLLCVVISIAIEFFHSNELNRFFYFEHHNNLRNPIFAII